MKTTIFYFSGTGNCLKTARDLAGELGSSEVVPISKAVREPAYKVSGSVGFVFPVYAFGVPVIVSDFIKKMEIDGMPYVFAIATCGGTASNAMGQISRELNKRGLKLSAGFVIKMPSNYTPFGGAISAEKQEKLFAKEAERVKEITRVVKESGECGLETCNIILRFLGVIISPIALRMMRREDKNFWTTGSCTACGVCAKVCPVGNIKIADKKPSWMHRCEQCFACLQWCPAEAVQYGKSTLGRKRYRNPYVKLQDFM